MPQLTACTSGCTVRFEHLTHCVCSGETHTHWPADPDVEGHQGCGDCGGCLPTVPVPGLAVCAHCEGTARRVLDAAAGWWTDMAEKPATGASGGRTSTGDPEACPDCDNGQPCTRDHPDSPTPLPEEVVWARSAIRAHLVTWCEILRDTARITLPNEAAIASTTRQLAAHQTDMADMERLAGDIARQPSADGTPPDPNAVLHHTKERHRRLALAAAARDDRETGRDVVRALAEHVTRHLDRLLASPDTAPTLLEDLREIQDLGRRYANRHRGQRARITCPDCAERVSPDRQDVPGLIRCPDCGYIGDADQWGADVPAEMTDDQVVEWLLTAHRIRTSANTIRTWARRGKIGRLRKADGSVFFNPVEVASVAIASYARKVG